MEIKTKDYWVNHFNFLPEVLNSVDIPETVEIYDLSLREGNQTPGCVIKRDEMYDLALSLDEMGVKFLEFFPAVSEDDEWVATQLATTGVLKNAKVCCLVRPHTTDLEYAKRCHAQHIFLEGPAHMYSAVSIKYGKDFSDLLQGFVDVIKEAHECGMTVTACPWDNGKATMEQMETWVRTLAAAGADDITYGDTFGYTMPWTMYYMVKKFREWSEDKVIISTHFHNDWGMATACTLAAVAAGARRVQVGMNYMGERAGNALLDEVVMNLELNMGVKTGIKKELLYPVAKRFEAITKRPLHPQKPFVGDEISWSGSGIVVDMMIKNREAGEVVYQGSYNPQMVGQPESFQAVWGKGCGSKMVANRAKQLGVDLPHEVICSIRDRVKKESLLTKALVSQAAVDSMILDAAT